MKKSSFGNELLLLRLYFGSLVIFFLLRLSFYIYHYALYSQTGMESISAAFLNGLVIDSSVAATILFILRLLTYPFAFFKPTLSNKLFRYSAFTLLSLCFLANLTDILYYGYFASRLNILFLDNLNQMGPILGTIVSDYKSYIAILVFVLIVAFFVWLTNSGLSPLRCRLCERFKVTTAILSLLLMIGLSFLWIGEPFWRLQSFAVGNQALSQLSLNGVYTLAKAIDQKRIWSNEAGGLSYQYRSDREAFDAVRPRLLSKNEEYLTDDNSFIRKIIKPEPITERKPNIVIILMESFTASYIGALNSEEQGLSPGFDSLANNGILFTNFYGHETRTHHGLVSTVGSFPSLLRMFITRRRGTDSFYTLATLLKEYGYATSFIYGYDQGFDHMGAFLKQGGIDKLYDRENFISPRYTGAWGVSDEDLFEKVNDIFSSNDSETPFFSVVLTSSNHPPFGIPDDFIAKHPEYSANIGRAAFAYSDFALSDFMKKASEKEYYKNTIFVIVSDHGVSLDDKDRNFKRFHIPCLIYAPYLIERPEIKTVVGGQVDIGTTLLHLIGYPDPFHFVGRDLLSLSEDQGFAVMRTDYSLFYRLGDKVLVRDIRDTTSSIYKVDSLSRMNVAETINDNALKARMNRELEDYLQTINYLFTSGTYRLR